MSEQGLKQRRRGRLKVGRALVCLAPVVIGWALCIGEGAAVAQEETQTENALRFVSVKPSVLLVREGGALYQAADAEIENTSDAAEGSIEVTLGPERKSTALGLLKKGRATYRVYVPHRAVAGEAQFSLKVDGRTRAGHKTTWRPQRQWTVCIVPITHHDLGYTDTIENVLNRYDGFYDDVLRFCEQTEDWPEDSRYRYTIEGTWSLQHFLENRPAEAAEKMARYVGQGRVEIGALFGNEIAALCSHEELVRLMYPSFRLQRQLGGEIRTGSITDVPGLAWGLPTVMAGAGVKYFFAGLPTYFEWGRNDIHTFWDESQILRHGRPDAFRWQGPDGASVLVYYQSSYGFFKGVTGPHSYEEVMGTLVDRLPALEKKGCPFSVLRYIHNGVDNYPPDVEISRIVRRWNEKWAYPRLVVATNTMFFEALEKQCSDVRTFRGELPHTDYVIGALSTAKETAINRLTHERIQSAEKSATIASLVSDYEYPAEKIRQVYDNMLLYDEHTWGKDYPAGQLQDWAWNEKSHFAYRAAGLTEPVLSRSLQKIAERVELVEKGRHIVVFNPLSFARTDIVRVTRFGGGDRFNVINAQTGVRAPHQIVSLGGPQSPSPYAAYRHARGQFEPHELLDLVFVAEDVPPMGYKTYRIVPAEADKPARAGVTVTGSGLENRFFKIAVDPETGGIKSIYDKQLEREMVDQQAPHKLNQLVARWVQTGKLEGPRKAEVRTGCAGPVMGSLVVRGVGPVCPQLTQEIILYDRIKRIDLANRVLKDSTAPLELYFAFPFDVDEGDFLFEGTNSVIRPFRDQFPGSNTNYYTVQHWADVSDGEVGVTLSPVESHIVEFGGLWPCYVSQAHHGVTPPGFGREFVRAEEITKGHMYSFVLDSNFRTNFQPVQQGDMLFRYSITTHTGRRSQRLCRDFGWAAGNALLPVLIDGARGGSLGPEESFCSIDRANVLLLTLKRAEDGRGVIVRLIETEGKDVTATVTLPAVTIKKACRANVVEQDTGEAAFGEHEIKVDLRAYGIATVRLELL